MKQYFIRSYFGDWHEVTEEKFNSFRDLMCSNMPAIPEKDREARFMEKHGRIEEV